MPGQAVLYRTSNFDHRHFAMSYLLILYPYLLPARREKTRFAHPLHGDRHPRTSCPQHPCRSTYRTRQNFHCCNYKVEVVSLDKRCICYFRGADQAFGIPTSQNLFRNRQGSHIQRQRCFRAGHHRDYELRSGRASGILHGPSKHRERSEDWYM